MNKILIIIKREFLNKVTQKSFIILTVLMPFVFAALVFVPLWLASIKDSNQKQVVIVDTTHHYAPQFQSDPYYLFVEAPLIIPEFKSDTSTIEAVVCITDDLAKNPNAVTIYSCSEVSQELLMLVEKRLNEIVMADKIEATGIPQIEQIVADLNTKISVGTIKWDKDGGETSSNTFIAIAAGFLFTFLIYMFVMSYGGMVMQSVMEEKTNRIVELMVSSVKPFQLMMGKIIGIALVGFVQLAIWGAMLFVILFASSVIFGLDAGAAAETQNMMAAGSMAQPNMPEMTETQEIMSSLINLPYFEMGTLFVVYFIGGYLLYASFFAAVGASVTEQEDSSQFIMPVMILMIFGLYAAIYSMENTNGPLAFWASLFPLTSPIVMMVRIPFDVPLWQEALSVVLLYGTAFLMVWIGAKIYRVGILMYGKKPSIKEMMKWIRYK